MPDLFDEFASVLIDVTRCVADRNLSWKLVTRDHITPVRDKDLWFWTKVWQGEEGEAEADHRAGRYAEFGHVEDLIAALSDARPDTVLSALRRDKRGRP